MNILWYVLITLFIFCIGYIVGYFISKSNSKYNNEYLANRVNELEKSIEDRNAGRIKIPIKYGWATYFVYQDATIEEVIKIIGSPTFINYNSFGNADRLSWYYKCSSFDDPINDKLIINFKDNRIINIKN